MSQPEGRGRITFMAAAAWCVTATIGLEVLAQFTLAMRPGADLDLVGGVACQSAAFLATLYLVARVHFPEVPLAEIVAFRRTHWSLYPLSVGLGVALEVPFSEIAAMIERRWPPSAAELAARAQAFEAPTPGRKLMLFVAAALVGPLVEELFFRGGIYRGVRRGYGTLLAILAVALFFALAHMDARHFLPIFVIGLVVTYTRAASGSLVPGLLVHATFNATSVLGSLDEKADLAPASASLPRSWVLSGLACVALVLVAYRTIAQKSRACATAREQDAF